MADAFRIALAWKVSSGSEYEYEEPSMPCFVLRLGMGRDGRRHAYGSKIWIKNTKSDRVEAKK